jgi:hypothetical protein
MIGMEVYAIPTGNNARGTGDKITTFKVMSVGRVYAGLSVVFDAGGIGTENNYLPESGATQKAIRNGYGGNAGYKFFLTLDELADYRHLKILMAEFDAKIRHLNSGNLNKIQIERIMQILGEV